MNEKRDEIDEMREEYDFSQGVRGKYAHRFVEGTNLVRVDDDLRKDFPDDRAVNEALRRYQQIRDLVEQ